MTIVSAYCLHTSSISLSFSTKFLFSNFNIRCSSSSPPSTSQRHTSVKTTKYPWANPNSRKLQHQPCSLPPEWPFPDEQSQTNPASRSPPLHTINPDKRHAAMERVALRLRNLGKGLVADTSGEGLDLDCDPFLMSPDGSDETLSDLLNRSWARPDKVSGSADADVGSETPLPWEKEDDGDNRIGCEEEEEMGTGKRRVRAPTLAELTMEDSELRRLRREAMVLRERVNVPKAGLTQEVLRKLHSIWRKSELARLKFHETLARNMRTAHEIVERRTGGLVIWRSGSAMVVYRGRNYSWTSPESEPADCQRNFLTNLDSSDSLYIPDVVPMKSVAETCSHAVFSIKEKAVLSDTSSMPFESLTEEEVEFNTLLDSLGPRYGDWWGTGILPVDADLLPADVSGYKTPFRLIPAGMRSSLTNAEMTNLRKLARSLPCHFALGRNRNHHGLAAAIVKLWEKSLVVKIAIKRGIQNTNNKLMAQELKELTGGTLLHRSKYFIVIYRGKDFLPPSVATALEEREELAKSIEVVEERSRISPINPTVADAKLNERLGSDQHDNMYEGNAHLGALKSVDEGRIDGQPLAGTLAEFLEARARWGREISNHEREKMKEESSRAKSVIMVKRVEHKLAIARTKKLRAERLLAKIEASMIPAVPPDDHETLSDEERFMFRRIGLRMKPYLHLGVRGVFGGTIENMHLHWKYRELVKLITKQKTLSFVEDTARLLEYESGGILVAIENVPKGYALIFYRGKNYQRPISIRPKTLLTKAKALKRAVAMQRHEALSQHISDLEANIEKMKSEILEV